MKTCSHCHTSNAEDNRFCQQCGRPLAPPAGPPSEATVQWTTQQAVGRVPRHTVPLAALFGTKERLVIGRAPDCDVCLPHPTVSRYHARLERRPGGLFLHDLGSVNGVWVGARRITEPTPIHEGERVGVGPFLFSLNHGIIQSLDSSRSLRLEARHLEKEVPLADGRTRKLLDDISLVVNPGEFVTLLGPSGSGKSTLMDCLNGRRRATGGQVLANGEDFYRHFDNFRQSLGYVPQKDIVHTQLTVQRALYYTACLRLPTDTDPAELQGRIEEVVRAMELGPHRDTLVADLSGGQIKRVSLGAELLAQPCLLYIDEATSGLDAGTETRMMRLFRGLADEGRSIVCITHNVDNVEQCHLVLVLARGKLVFFGPPQEAPRYFKVRRVSEIYDRLAQKDVEAWEKEYAASPLYQEFVRDRLAPPPFVEPVAAPAPPPAESPPAEGPRPVTLVSGVRSAGRSEWPLLADRFRRLTARYLRLRELFLPLREQWHQFRVLTARYVELILGDRRGLRLLLLQAPIVAVFLLVGFVHKDFRARMPLARPLDPEERRVLAALDGVNRLLDADAPLDPAQRAALHKVHFRVEVRGLPATLDGTQVVGLLRQLWQRPLSAAEERTLESARFNFVVDGKPTTLSGADLLRVMRKLRAASVPAKLLAIEGPVVPEREGVNPRNTYVLLFIVVMIVLWFGCNNAAKEIVKEEAIYGRERAVNLGILPYLASKFLVLSVMTVLHALLLMAILYGTLAALAYYLPGHTTPAPQHMLDYLPQLGVLVLLSMTGVALGLFLSACVSTPDRANALLPYVLIPQIILGGGLVAVQHGLIYVLAAILSPVYWAYRAVRLGAHELPHGAGRVAYPDGALLPCEALVIQMMVLLLLTAWFLRRKEA